MKFEVYSRLGLLGRRWRWRLVAGNGEIVASGESYWNKADAVHATELVRGSVDAVVEVEQ